MKLRIDKSGRIVVPKPLRERLGFEADAELEALDVDGGVLLRKTQQRQAMTKVEGLWVHRGVAQPAANWDRVIERVREERIESVSRS